MTDSLIYLREACSDVLGCSYAKGQRLAKSGELPFFKLGATWVVSKSALYDALRMQFESEVDDHDAPNKRR